MFEIKIKGYEGNKGKGKKYKKIFSYIIPYGKIEKEKEYIGNKRIKEKGKVYFFSFSILAKLTETFN